MKQIASLTAAVAAVVVLVLLFTAPVITVAAAQAPPSGQEIFLAQKCNTCHSVPTAGIEAKTTSEKMKGPDLVDLDRDAATLKAFITQQGELDGKKHKKAAKGSDAELDALVAWLLAQKK